MANSEHLTLLEKGRTTWTAWRKAHRSGAKRIYPNLSGAVLNGMNLAASTSHTNLWGAKLRKADLTGANL